MLKYDKNIKDAEFILDNLRCEDIEELQALWGKNWKNETLKSIKSTDFIIVKGFNKERNIIPIVIGGFFEPYKTNPRVACVWMLSTKYIKYNRYLMMKVLKSQIASASERYEIMYNFIYQSNTKAKNWLKRLGFKFDNPHPKNLKIPVGFEFFYKLHR